MAELLQTNELSYRSCILYEALQKQPVEEAYQRMKKVMPNLNYLDFEYWYFRFWNGNHDLNHDRSSDPKTRGFSDLTIDMVDKIVGNLGLVDKLSTRRVCRGLRAVINGQKSEFNNVCMKFMKSSCDIQFETRAHKYSGHEYLKRALRELCSVLTNPNWKFKHLSLDFGKDEDDSDLFLESIASNPKIEVEHLKIKAVTLTPMIQLLSKFQENVLESIHFNCDTLPRDMMERLSRMDHWKNARELKLKFAPDWLPIENLFHCKRFTVYRMKITNKRLVQIRDVLFNSPTFEFCSLRCFSEQPYVSEFIEDEEEEEEEDDELMELKNSVMQVMEKHKAFDRRTNRFRVSESYYFQMKLKRHDFWLCLEIEKKAV